MNRAKALRLTLSSFLLLAGFVSQAQAQTPAATFEELRASFQLKPKDYFEWTDASGAKYNGRITAISDRSISVITRGMQRDFLESDIRQIRREKHDGLGNGIALGALAGVGAGLVGTAATCSNDPECEANAGAVLLPTFAGIGAGLGALLDVMQHKHETIFDRRTTTGNLGLRVAPFAGKNARGVKVSFKF